MKKIAFFSIIAMNLATSAQANDADVVSKITQCYNIATNGSILFKAEKKSKNYDISMDILDSSYKVIFKKDLKIHLEVDDGPLITNPSFGFGKAGIIANGSIVDFLNKNTTDSIDSKLKKQLNYKYEGKVSFGGELISKATLDAITLNNPFNKTEFKTSTATINSSMNIDSCIDKTVFNLESIEYKSGNHLNDYSLKGLSISSQMTEKAIDNFALFVKTTFSIDKLTYKGNFTGKQLDLKLSANLNGEIKRVDKKYANLFYKTYTKALSANTIAFFKGIKESTFNFEIDNSEIDGLVNLIALSKKMQKAEDQMINSKTEAERQKALLEYRALTTTKIVPVYNQILIKDKTRLKLNLELNSEKTSFVKVDLLYKAEPIQDNIQSAMITLMAQNLAVADGTIEIQVEKDIATNINPLALILLDLLKTKGFATEKNGLYYLKAELKGGKVIIDGKKYTLQELSSMSF